MKKILITGASGYIGTCLFKYLINKKFNVYGTDKKKFFLKNYAKRFYKGNLNNKFFLSKVLLLLKPDLIIHLAGESTLDGIKKKKNYILNNSNATKNLITCMQINKIKNLIFSSTAAVYKANPKNLTETSKISPNNIYGSTKLYCEDLIKKNSDDINYIIFRFFNVCSAIPKLKVGELHNPETHLIPLATYKLRKKKNLKIYGNNYQTKDGTCIRDYIHISDLCLAFQKTINSFFNHKVLNSVFNLGSGRGYSVMDIIKKISTKIHLLDAKKYLKISDRRLGDTPRLVCNYNKAVKFLKWRPKKSYLDNIINDEILWQKNNKFRYFIY